MSIKDDFKNYTDTNGYLNPMPVDSTAGRSCDNATMYSSEVYLIFKYNGVFYDSDNINWGNLIENAMTVPGLPGRYPGYDDQDSPDNMVAILAGCKVFNRADIARSILKFGLLHWGSFDNQNPGSFRWDAMLWRQPQLLTAAISASFPFTFNPGHVLVRLLAFPLYFYTAIVIAISCYNTDISNTDSRRLSWLLIKSVSSTSVLCWLASKFWNKRLKKDYPNGMKDVAAIYYKPNGLDQNPYSKYWVD